MRDDNVKARDASRDKTSSSQVLTQGRANHIEICDAKAAGSHMTVCHSARGPVGPKQAAHPSTPPHPTSWIAGA